MDVTVYAWIIDEDNDAAQIEHDTSASIRAVSGVDPISVFEGQSK